MGDLQAALKDINRALQINPKAADTYYNRGLLYIKLKNNQLALKDFQQAASIYKQQQQTKDYQDALDQIKELQQALL